MAGDRRFAFVAPNCTRVVLAAVLLGGVPCATTPVAAAAPLGGPAPSQTTKPEVYNGTEAIAEKSRWQVALTYRTLPSVEGLFCGGTFVGKQWVLTAAHCFHNEACTHQLSPIDFYVLHGSVQLTPLTARATADGPVIFSPDWDCKSRRGDIALVKLKQAVAKDWIALADLAQSSKALNPGFVHTVSGWGLTTAGTKSRDLMEAPIRIVDSQVCSQAYGTALPPNTVCGGDGVHDACTGDSGGALFSRSANGTAYQLGVVGFGKGCGDKKFPGVYTRVEHYAEWIRKAIVATCSPGQIAAGQC